MLAPPFIITESEIDELVARFTRALDRALAAARPAAAGRVRA
jgi:adenosylmethionine-8-amino-7-oxononanoate aminotransferase